MHVADSEDIAQHMPVLEAAAALSAFVIELGCGDGNGSLRALTAGLRRSPLAFPLYISVDLRPDRPCVDVPTEHWWNVIHGDSADPAVVNQAKAIAGDRKADLIFIDTAHTIQQMRLELELWSHFAHRGTTWLFHDTWMGGGYNRMTDAIKEFAAANNWKYKDLSKASAGLGRMVHA